MWIKEDVLYRDFNYISYITTFYLIVLAEYMLQKEESLWNSVINIIFKRKH